MHLSGVFLSGHLRITTAAAGLAVVPESKTLAVGAAIVTRIKTEEAAAAVPAIVVAVVTAGLVRKCCR